MSVRELEISYGLVRMLMSSGFLGMSCWRSLKGTSLLNKQRRDFEIVGDNCTESRLGEVRLTLPYESSEDTIFP